MAYTGEYGQGHVSLDGLVKVTKEDEIECWLTSDSYRAMAQNASNSGLEANWELTGGLRVIQTIWRLKYIELDALLPSRLGAPEPMVLDLFAQNDKAKAYKSIQCLSSGLYPSTHTWWAVTQTEWMTCWAMHPLLQKWARIMRVRPGCLMMCIFTNLQRRSSWQTGHISRRRYGLWL